MMRLRSYDTIFIFFLFPDDTASSFIEKYKTGDLI